MRRDKTSDVTALVCRPAREIRAASAFRAPRQLTTPALTGMSHKSARLPDPSAEDACAATVAAVSEVSEPRIGTVINGSARKARNISPPLMAVVSAAARGEQKAGKVYDASCRPSSPL